MKISRLVHFTSAQRCASDATEEDGVLRGFFFITCERKSLSADLHGTVVIADTNLKPCQLAEHSKLLTITIATFEA